MTDIRKARVSTHCGFEFRARKPPPERAAQGWSLVELLVASAIGMSLVTLALRAFLAGSGLWAEANAELRLQAGARYAFHVIAANARLAGFPGCLGETAEFSPLSVAWSGPVSFQAVEGWDENRPHPANDLVAAGDVVAFWWSTAGCGADAPPQLLPPDAASAAGLRGGLFHIGRRGGSAASPPALFMRELSSVNTNNAVVELVEGVESMRVFYLTGGNGAEMPAHAVQDWQAVRGVRVELDLRGLLVQDLGRTFSRLFWLRNHAPGSAEFPLPAAVSETATDALAAGFEGGGP